MTLPAPTLFDQLDLTSSQRAAVDSVMEESRLRIEQSMTPLLDSIQVSVSAAHASVRGLLEPEQEVQFDSLLSAVPVIRLQRGG